MTFLSAAEASAAGLDGLSSSAGASGGCCVSASLLMVTTGWLLPAAALCYVSRC